MAVMTGEVADEPAEASENPFFESFSLPFAMPPFDQIEDTHFKPAMERGMEEHLAEIEQIANNADAPTFENTIVAMERSGQTLNRTLRVFSNLNGADTNDARQAIQREMSPRLSAHQDAIQLNPALFARVEALYEQREELSLDSEALRVLEDYHRDFVRAGAQLDDEQKARLREINTALANLGTQFSQNVLSEVNDSAIVVDTAEQLAGLNEAEIQAAADEAERREMPGSYVLTLMNTSGQP
ncbi:MAG: dipeptidyl carboxypeptidase II, partial [Pseudomonadota bacterium]